MATYHVSLADKNDKGIAKSEFTGKKDVTCEAETQEAAIAKWVAANGLEGIGLTGWPIRCTECAVDKDGEVIVNYEGHVPHKKHK